VKVIVTIVWARLENERNWWYLDLDYGILDGFGYAIHIFVETYLYQIRTIIQLFLKYVQH